MGTMGKHSFVSRDWTSLTFSYVPVYCTKNAKRIAMDSALIEWNRHRLNASHYARLSEHKRHMIDRRAKFGAAIIIRPQWKNNNKKTKKNNAGHAKAILVYEGFATQNEWFAQSAHSLLSKKEPLKWSCSGQASMSQELASHTPREPWPRHTQTRDSQTTFLMVTSIAKHQPLLSVPRHREFNEWVYFSHLVSQHIMLFELTSLPRQQ